MNEITLRVGEAEYLLLYNGAAHFELRGRYGETFLSGTDLSKKEDVLKIIDMLCVLAEQGELCRRETGYDAQPFLTAQKLLAVMLPADVITVHKKLLAAVSWGLRRDVADAVETGGDGRIDEGLLELQKKTEIR